jgi:GNAT superfamily N-acetyltransferase
MTVTIKALAEKDFFGWYGLLNAYATESGIALDDERAMLIWTAVQGSTARAEAVLAFDEGGTPIGFAHIATYDRLVQGVGGYTIEDLFVDEGSRRTGAATAIVEHIRTRAENEGRPGVRWVARPDDEAVTALFAKFSESNDWLLHDLALG